MKKTLNSRIGEKYGKLTIIGIAQKRGRHYYVVCRCDCGNEKIIEISNILAKSGMTLSCGCLKESKKVLNKIEHKRIYGIFHGIKTRCYNPSCKSYKNYGGRGITICDEWKNDFYAFYNWAVNNGYTDSLSIDRIDVNGNYEPSNCRWVTSKIQNNNRRTNKVIEYKGEKHNLCEWAKILNIKHNTLCMRLKKWDIEKAFNMGVK